MDQSTPRPPESVPLFPLPNVVLFPRVALPLHLFEPRYRQMAADAIRGAGYIALAHLKTGFCSLYYTLQAPIYPTVCLARICESEKLPNGNYNILVQGVMRARVVEESTEGVYRVAHVEHLAPVRPARGLETAARTRLECAVERSSLIEESHRQDWLSMLAGEHSLDVLTDLLATDLPISAALQQVLLDEADSIRRSELLVDLIEVMQAIRDVRLRVGLHQN
jgi:Lon protease-like protein